MDGTFFLLAGGLLIILFAVIVAVVSSVTSAVAADVDDERINFTARRAFYLSISISIQIVCKILTKYKLTDCKILENTNS